MLSNAKVHPTLSAVNLERAKKFYVEKLGLKVIQEDPTPGAMIQAGEGSGLYLYERGKTKAEHTVASFTVGDVEGQVAELKKNGVSFEEYDTPDLKTVNGIATIGEIKAAWFKDTEGNILAITNM